MNRLSPLARAWALPVVWALAATAVLGFTLSRTSWPYVDLYRNFYDATSRSWSETVAAAFGSGVEYRPLLTIGVKLAHQLVGLRAWCYKALVVGQFAAILLALIWIFQPRTTTRAVAACIALSCVVGFHGSRVLFMFGPLNAYSMGLLLVLAGVLLALSPQSAARELVFFPLTLLALLLLELGILIPAATLILWRMNAPGVRGRAVAATLTAVAAYAALRLGLGAQTVASTYADTGLGFGDVSASRLAELFANAPWLLWIYNVIAMLLTVAVSEPRAGRYRFIEAILHGNVPIFMYVHVITSVLTTAIVVYVVRSGRITDARDRLMLAAGVALVLVGSALGFLYTRDRIALSAGAGYAMLVYVALANLASSAPSGWQWRLAGRLCVAIVAAGWMIRVGETYFAVRDAAWENRQEWTTRYEELGGHVRPQTDVLERLREAALATMPADSRRDPAWTYVLFERAHDRIADD